MRRANINRLVANGYMVGARSKLPILGGSDCHVQFGDGTDVTVAKEQLTILFRGEGALRCCKPEFVNMEPDESCVMGDLRVEWAGKAVIEQSPGIITFRDGTWVSVGSDATVLGTMCGDGLLLLVRMVQ